MPWDDVVANVDTLCRSAEYVKIWWVPGMSSVHVARYTRVDRDSKETWSAFRRKLDDGIQKWVMPAMFSLQERIPSTVSSLNALVGSAILGKKRTVGMSDDVLSVQMPAVHREMEYSMPVEHAAEAMRVTRKIIEDNNLHVNFILEVRFVKGDGNYLSPDFGRDSVRVGAYTAFEKDCEAYFREFELAMKKLDGVPHWGKEFNIGGEFCVREVFGRYPKAARFVEIARELDPFGMFTNDFTERVLGLGKAPRPRL